MKNTNEYKTTFESMERIYLSKGIDAVKKQYEDAMKLFKNNLRHAYGIKEVCERNNWVYVGKGHYSYDYKNALSGIQKWNKHIEIANLIMQELKSKYNF